jgi:hypothetical protein
MEGWADPGVGVLTLPEWMGDVVSLDVVNNQLVATDARGRFFVAVVDDNGRLVPAS